MGNSGATAASDYAHPRLRMAGHTGCELLWRWRNSRLAVNELRKAGAGLGAEIIHHGGIIMGSPFDRDLLMGDPDLLAMLNQNRNAEVALVV